MENTEKKMTAKKFWKDFQKNVCGNEELKKEWFHFKKFTVLIMDKIEQILKYDEDVATEREYFRVDLISYRENNENEFLLNKLYNYTWNLEAAVEHENNSKTWMDEVIKLAHLSCDLRVVIGYLPLSEKKNQKEYLNKIADILNNKISAWKQTKTSGDFLIILGDSSFGSSEQYIDNRCVYTPFLYSLQSNLFEEIV